MAIVKVENKSYTVEPLYQWDLNQVLEIRGLSMAAVPEVHFTNDAMVRAVRRFATMDDAGVIRAEVPNALLQTAAKVRALVCIREGEVFKTYHEIRIPVKARPQPADYTITDDQDIYSFLELENLVYENITKAEQAVASAAASAAQAADAANTATQTANVAQATAEAAAEAAGSVAAAVEAADAKAEEAKNAAEAAAAVHATIVLPVNGWTDAAPYTQTVPAAGILETDQPHYGVIYSADLSTAMAEKEAFAMVDDLDTAAGSVTFTCFEAAPAVNLTIQLEVNR